MEIIYRFDNGLGNTIRFRDKDIWYATYFFDENKLFKTTFNFDDSIMESIIAYLNSVGIESKVVH